MKCPKYIRQALLSRAKHAEEFISLDVVIYEWLEKHEIEVNSYDIATGAESLCNPYSSSYRILEAIEKAGEDK